MDTTRYGAVQQQFTIRFSHTDLPKEDLRNLLRDLLGRLDTDLRESENYSEEEQKTICDAFLIVGLWR